MGGNSLNISIMEKYKQNLEVRGNYIYSYRSHVATIDWANETIVQLGYWSITTQKHINYVTEQLGFKLVKPAKK